MDNYHIHLFSNGVHAYVDLPFPPAKDMVIKGHVKVKEVMVNTSEDGKFSEIDTICELLN